MSYPRNLCCTSSLCISRRLPPRIRPHLPLASALQSPPPTSRLPNTFLFSSLSLMASQHSSSMYPSLDTTDLAENLFPDDDGDDKNKNNHSSTVEETLIRVPGAILHLIDKQRSVELGYGDLTILRLRQGESVVAVVARVADSVQWPLAKDEAAVRLDDSHYFFSFRVPPAPSEDEDLLNYGLTFASKGQESLLKELDGILEHYTSFPVQKVEVVEKGDGKVLEGEVAKGTAPGEVAAEGSEKREAMERESSAYWTTLAPNVEDYSGSVARAIAMGSGHVIKGMLWCGEVAVERLKWGNDLLMKRMASNSAPAEISPEAMQRIKRVKMVTKMSEKVASGILSGVVKVSGYFTSAVVNSKAGKKFFRLLPGEVVLASLDGFSKICDAAELVGKNVLSTSSTVTTGLVSHRYGEQAAEMTNQSLDAAGHAMGTAWAVFKIRKALDPKSSIKPTTLGKSAVKAAAAELKGKQK